MNDEQPDLRMPAIVPAPPLVRRVVTVDAFPGRTPTVPYIGSLLEGPAPSHIPGFKLVKADARAVYYDYDETTTAPDVVPS